MNARHGSYMAPNYPDSLVSLVSMRTRACAHLGAHAYVYVVPLLQPIFSLAIFALLLCRSVRVRACARDCVYTVCTLCAMLWHSS